MFLQRDRVAQCEAIGNGHSTRVETVHSNAPVPDEAHLPHRQEELDDDLLVAAEEHLVVALEALADPVDHDLPGRLHSAGWCQREAIENGHPTRPEGGVD